ncbi:MAG TPA: hypothetical protein VIS95_04240 [Solirubrobacterales bacterium]
MKARGLVLLVTASLFASAAAPAVADEGFGLKDLEVTFTNQDGSPASLAGSHPYAATFDLAANTEELPGGEIFPIDAVKDILIEQPSGFAGNPTAVPTCSAAMFLKAAADAAVNCPNQTVLGKTRVAVNEAKDLSEVPFVPIYNMVPPPGAVLKLGFIVVGIPVTIEVGLSSVYPFNPLVKVTNVSQITEFYAASTTVWGNPADPVHDSERGTCLESNAADKCSAGTVEEEPFITSPRSCTGPLVTLFEADSWQNPGIWFKAPPVETFVPDGLSGCNELEFEPQTFDAQPTSDRAESPAGLDVELTIDDEGIGNPTGRAQTDMKKVVVMLPEGMTANPSFAEGLGVCPEAGFDAESADSAPGEGCPQASKIGTVEVETPLLEGKLFHGQLFIAEPRENPFGTLLALYLVIRAPELGVLVRLPGKIEPDPRSGQLITTFGEAPYEIPQFPVSRLRVRLREGGRSPLVTPPSCGSFSVDAQFATWADPENPLTVSSSFPISRGTGGGSCPAGGTPPFGPGFEAGTINNAAGSYAPFSMRLTRSDGEQDLTKFSALLPPGVLGKLAGLSRCPDQALAAAMAKSGRAEQASPSCPASSRIGSVLAGAGVGSALTYVGGDLYLSGPYNGAPLSVAAIVPAVAGPFDVGTVITRVALDLDPTTARVVVDGSRSDPIPHILAGIPLKVRDVRVFAGRPSFTLNPTSCDPSETAAEIFGSGADVFNPADDGLVARSARFQASSCASLGFRPSLRFQLKGGTRRGDHPAFNATYTPRLGDANLEGLVVRLPRSAFLDQAHIRTICTRVQFAADACPKAAQYGFIKATTPLLDEPLQGPVYLRSSDRNLPDLVFDLQGIVDIEVSTRIDSVRGGIRARIESAPDAPISKVELTMQGGRKGLIVNSRDLCEKGSRANVQFAGHNGKIAGARPTLRVGCGGKQGKRQRKRR